MSGSHSETQTLSTRTRHGVLRLRGEEAQLVDAHSAHVQGGRELEQGGGIAAENPDWWPTTRAVPPFRPLNRHQDFASRPYGSNGPETVFVTLMLGGVWLQGLVRTAWQVVGKPGKDYFRYQIGGAF